MFASLRKLSVIVVLALTASTVWAQSDPRGIDAEIDRVLRQKNLLLAVKEAEMAPGNDTRSLLWRLNLYRRSANTSKTQLLVRQVLNTVDETTFRSVSPALYSVFEDDEFQDASLLQRSLRFEYNDRVYGKLCVLCFKENKKCDLTGVDKWLEEQVRENVGSKDDRFPGTGSYTEWVTRRLDWRKRSGMSNDEILSQFIEAVRKNPADLRSALGYLLFLNNPQDIHWLVDNFASRQAYDFYELGQRVRTLQYGGPLEKAEFVQIQQLSIRLFQKSLSLPFNEKDKELMWSHRLAGASISPRISNHEKQLRVWTKKELAEAFKSAGEPHSAQPIVEELINLDQSDILSDDSSQLAGAVQAASGARALESKILNEQGSRQDSLKYWTDRISYYVGRDEPKQVVASYLQALSSIPFEVSNEASRYNRLRFIRDFADFRHNPSGSNDDVEDPEWGDEQKEKWRVWKDVETFLKGEFERNRANTAYAYLLAIIIEENDFVKLSEYIFNDHNALLVEAAKIGSIADSDDLLHAFFNEADVAKEKKVSVALQLLKVAEKLSIDKASIIYSDVAVLESPVLARLMLPSLKKNLKRAETNLDQSKGSENDRLPLRDLKDKYVRVLFSSYLSANDRKSAEKLAVETYPEILGFPVRELIMNALKNGANAEAMEYWKVMSNLDRRSVSLVPWAAQYPVFAKSLREYYAKMKEDEPSSPIPDRGLAYLK